VKKLNQVRLEARNAGKSDPDLEKWLPALAQKVPISDPVPDQMG